MGFFVLLYFIVITLICRSNHRLLLAMYGMGDDILRDKMLSLSESLNQMNVEIFTRQLTINQSSTF